MKETLYQKIFKMFTLLVLISTLVLLFVVWNSTSKNIIQNLEKRLEVAEKIVVREINNQHNENMSLASSLFNEVDFKRALSKADNKVLQIALEQFRVDLNANLINLASFDGSFMAYDNDLYSGYSALQLEKTKNRIFNNESIVELQIINNKLAWVYLLPVETNTVERPIMIASLVYFIDKRRLLDYKTLTELDISLHARTNKDFIISSLPNKDDKLPYLESSLIEKSNTLLNTFGIAGVKNDLLSSKAKLNKNSGLNYNLYVSANATTLSRNFITLQLTIGAISLFALLIAMITVRILAKQITRPIEYIADYAQDISQGNYSSGIELHTCSTELDQLLRAFRAMESGVKTREKEIIYQSKRDKLTKLYNRNYLTTYLDELITQSKDFQVLTFNIKNFRSINDIFGYQCGDLLLKELASRIDSLAGTAARVTGGEVVWIPESPLPIEEIEHIKLKVDSDVKTENATIPFKTAVGIVNCPANSTTTERVYRRLNITVDEAQFSANLIVEFNNKFENKYLRRLSIIKKLKNALTQDEGPLSLHYQPKLSLASNTIEHAEALIRWTDKELGFIPPDEFIEIAEQAGLINALTIWVIKRAAADLNVFKKDDIKLQLAINISAEDLLSDTFIDNVTHILDKNSLCNKDISFELTEGVILDDPKKAIAHMCSLKEAGYSLAIDDFGKGYSSLSYVSKLPVDIIKIDKCFVTELASSKGDQVICQTVLQLAKNFNMCAVAEGVEDNDALQLLKQWGCQYAQGYHISRPLCAKDLSVWMSAHSTGLKLQN